ncbi:MAG: sulfotransferase, partial [Bacillota bacterium]
LSKEGVILRNIFITGMLRSGTTLLEKLLHNHSQINIASQPFPLFYIALKENYLQENNIKIKFPLENYFLKGRKRVDGFYDFLKDYTISKDESLNILDKLNGYNGQQTPEIFNKKYFKKISSGIFSDVYLDLINIINDLYQTDDTIYSGSKEVLCEEYLPFILSQINDTKGIIIIRDPRDVITSLSFGCYKQHTGKRRPILFDLRNWRKSVAFGLYLQEKSNFKLVTYEDIVTKTFNTLNSIADFLAVDKFHKEIFSSGIKDQSGEIWSGNSSFSNKDFINKDSMGKYKSLLSSDVIKYIESCCYPEMKYLDYEFDYTDNFNKNQIINFVSPFNIERNNFIENYSCTKKNIKQEIIRYKKLREKQLTDNQKQKWYIFREVYNKLEEII